MSNHTSHAPVPHGCLTSKERRACEEASMTAARKPCEHLNGVGVNHIEAMGCESWYYECEECGVLTMQVVEYPQARLNRFHLSDGPTIDWLRVNRIHRPLVMS